jgi:hypothetical protein
MRARAVRAPLLSIWEKELEVIANLFASKQMCL